MRIIAYICVFLSVSLSANAQDSWGSLSMIETTKQYDPEFGIEVVKTVVSPMVQSLNGKEIQLRGYIIPLTGETAQSHYMFSKFPQNMCFFCGMAGPETAIQVFMKDAEKVSFTPDKIEVKGKLKIHDDQASGLLYTLEDAEIIK